MARTQHGTRMQAAKLWQAIRQPNIFWPAVFVFLWQATPSSDSAMFYFYNNELNFGPEFLGRVRLAGSVSSLIGIYLYNSYFKNISLRKMFRGCAIVGTLLSLTQVRTARSGACLLCVLACL
jgi:Na+/melibiose symporter-like transporter